MAIETHIHRGNGLWAKLDELHIHRGNGLWADVQQMFIHRGDGNWEMVLNFITDPDLSAIASTMDYDANDDDVTDNEGCACKIAKLTKVCLGWDFTTPGDCDNNWHHIEIHKATSSGGSFQLVADDQGCLANSAAAWCNTEMSARDGKWIEGTCNATQFWWKAKVCHDSDDSVIDETGETTRNPADCKAIT